MLRRDVSGGPSVAKRVAYSALIAVGVDTVVAGNPEHVPLRGWPRELPEG